MGFQQKFELVQANLGKLQTPLGQLASGPLLDLNAKKEFKGDFGGGQWNYQIGMQASALLQVLASSSDKDPDAIFGEAATKEGTALSTVIHPEDGKAWLKYSLNWNGSGKVKTGAGLARLEFSGQANAGLGAYCPAPADATLASALQQQDGVPLVFDASDMRALAVGQAAYVAVGGTLSAKLEFNWADVLTGSLKPLQALTTGNAPVNLSVDLKAGFAVAVTISDSFRLVFAGHDKDYVAAVLNRASSKAFAVDAGVSADIHLEKPDIARDVLAGLAAQVFGVDRTRLAAIREQIEKALSFYDDELDKIRAQVAGLAGKLDAAIDAQGLPRLLTRLGQLQELAGLAGGGTNAIGATAAEIQQAATSLDGLAGKLEQEVDDKLDELLAKLGLPKLVDDATRATRGLLEKFDKVEAALLAIAKKRIEVGLKFEYRRIATDETVLKVRLRRSHADFAQWHDALLGLDARKVLAASSPTNDDVVLDLFLNQKSIKRSVSLGLDLGWFYTDTDSAATQWTISERAVSGATPGAPLSTERRATLKGTRSREEKIFGSVCECSGQFDADFHAVGGPGASGKWNFALALTYASTIRKADRAWLQALADYATVWGVVPESQVSSLLKTLEDDGAIGQQVSMEVCLALSQAAFTPKLLSAMAQAGETAIADSLAVALQRIDGFPERDTASARRKAYGDAIKVLLGTKGIDVTKPAAVARYVASHLGAGGIALRDFEKANPILPGSVADIVKRSGSFLGVFREFRDAGRLAPLVGAQKSGDPAERDIVWTAFRGLDLAWRDRILLRWQVDLLRKLAAGAGVGAATTSTMKVTTGTRGKARIFSADLA